MSPEQSGGENNNSTNPEDNITNANSKTTGLNKNILRVITIFGSIWIGLVLGLWFLVQGNIILSGISFLIGSGIPVLLAMIEGELGVGIDKNRKDPRKNKFSSSTKQCPDCGWHNHQANNNCVDCGETFANRTGHQQSKYICQNCGWKNPHNNNYCVDCGVVLNE